MPRVLVQWSERVNDAAQRYFEEAKKWRKKREGAEAALAQARQKLVAAESAWTHKQETGAVEARPSVRVKADRKREWFERFHWFTTTHGFLVLAGKDARQNDALVKAHLDPTDLFLHADIQGAAATVFKTTGKPLSDIPSGDVQEAAQFAASYSSAWKRSFGTVDVYAVRGEQVSKMSHGEYVAKGGFVMHGERTWFRNTELGIALARAGKEARAGEGAATGAGGAAGTGMLVAVPRKRAGEKLAELVPGDKEKSMLAREFAKKLGASVDELLGLLPGNARVVA